MVRGQGDDWAARVPLHETFVVFVDKGEVLRTTHRIWLGKHPLVRLDYMRLDSAGQSLRGPSGCRLGSDPPL